MAGLGARLYQLQVRDAPRYRRLADRNRIDIQMFAPTRGRILDRNGEILADNQETRRIVIIPDLAGDLEKTLKMLAQIITLSEESQKRIIKRAKRQNSRIPIDVASALSWEDMAKVNVMMPDLFGVQTDSGFNLRSEERRVGQECVSLGRSRW